MMPERKARSPATPGTTAHKYSTGGIDVSLRSVSICVVDEVGVVRHENKVAADVDVVVAALRRFSAEVRQVGLEAGTLTQHLTYGLKYGPATPRS
jgi:hypothetical protein